MSTMPNYGGPQSSDYVVEERTSVMAIMALVLSLICFIPGLGVIAVILGIAALIAISGSRGRLAGKGMAIGGIILGLIFSALWIGLGVGAAQVAKMLDTQVNQGTIAAFENIEQGDFAAARELLLPEHAAKITDADFIAFRDEYTVAVGSFSGGASGWGDMFQLYSQLGPAMNRLQNRNDAIPVPMRFATNPAVVVLQIDTQAQNADKIPIRNLQVITNNGQEITLYDPARVPGAPVTPPATPPVTPPAPATPTDPPANGG